MRRQDAKIGTVVWASDKTEGRGDRMLMIVDTDWLATGFDEGAVWVKPLEVQRFGWGGPLIRLAVSPLVAAITKESR